jgi:hypothetical protein
MRAHRAGLDPGGAMALMDAMLFVVTVGAVAAAACIYAFGIIANAHRG